LLRCVMCDGAAVPQVRSAVGLRQLSLLEAPVTAPGGSRGWRCSRKCRCDAGLCRLDPALGGGDGKWLRSGGRNLHWLRLCCAESREETADEAVFFAVYSGTMRRPVRLGVRIRAIGRRLRFEVGVADAERSRQSQLEYSETEERKSRAFDQVIYSVCSTALAFGPQCTFQPRRSQQSQRLTEQDY
jgi:hypothetical protein